MINQVDVFVLYDEVQFTRRDWRNRNKIKTPQGLQWLTIPVEVKGKYEQKISETLIADPSWAKKHWEMIRRNYRKAANFDSMSEVFEELYQKAAELETLSEVNEHFLLAINELLKIETPLRQSSDFDLAEDRNERLISICRELGATTYLSGPAAKSYLDETIFAGHNISVEWVTYGDYPVYDQLHGDFEHGVSVVDLVLNMGESAHEFSGM